MFRLPAFVFALIGRDAQCEALFAQQHVAAVAGVDGHDGVVLREVDDIALFLVQLRLGMQALDVVHDLLQTCGDGEAASVGDLPEEQVKVGDPIAVTGLQIPVAHGELVKIAEHGHVLMRAHVHMRVLLRYDH